MMSYAQSGFLVVLAMAAAFSLVAVLNRIWPVGSRKMINDVNGWQLAVLGTTYGVILGFMLFTVWAGFRGAQVDAALEATSVLNVYEIAEGLPSPQREGMRELARKYADVALNQEWPAMQRQEENHAGRVVLEQMWQVLMSAKTQNFGENNSADHISNAISNLSERRNLRQNQLESRLPSLLWVLLVVGGAATVISSCLLGNDKEWLHYCQVLALTFVVAVTLAAIADLARPFEGSIRVQPLGFVRALALMQERKVP